MRIRDWSSDVCSSDLEPQLLGVAVRVLVWLLVKDVGLLPEDCLQPHGQGESLLVKALPIEIEMKVLARKLRRPLESRLPLVLQGCLHQGDIGEVREHVGQPATGTLLIPRIGTAVIRHDPADARSEEHTSELQSLMRSS